LIETILQVAIVLAIGFPVALNLIGPLIVWKTQKIPADTRFNDIDDGVIMEEATPLFFQFHHSITDIGFRSLGASTVSDSLSTTYFRLYWHHDLRVAATVVMLKNKVEEISYMEFTERFNDGSVLDVSNSPQHDPFPRFDFKAVFRFPETVEARELLRAHLKVKQLLKKDLQAQQFDLSNGFREIEAYIRKESDALVEKGVLRPEIDADGKRAPTLFGAFFLTWRSIFPGKNLLTWITARRSRKILRQASDFPVSELPAESKQPQEVLRSVIQGTVSFIDAMGDDADHMMVFLEEHGDLPFFTSAAVFDQLRLDEGQHVRLNVELASNQYIGQNQLWITGPAR